MKALEAAVFAASFFVPSAHSGRRMIAVVRAHFTLCIARAGGRAAGSMAAMRDPMKARSPGPRGGRELGEDGGGKVRPCGQSTGI